MKLVKLPEFDEEFVYINPEFVVSLYVEGEFTIVITNGGEDWRIPLPIDEVASRLVNGNTMHDIMENLKEDNHEDKLLMENKTTKIKKPKCKRRS